MAGPLGRRAARLGVTGAVVSSTALLSLGAAAAAPGAAPDRPATSAAAARADRAPLLGAGAAGAIPGRYIVVMDKGTSGAARRAAVDVADAAGGTVHFRYSAALSGFAATLPVRAVREDGATVMTARAR